MIEVKNLTKKFGEVVAVDNVSFDVKRGEVLGFLGPNGAGKSTTMRIITCFLSPTSGSVSVAGADAVSDSMEVRKKIGYLPENAPLYDDMEVLEYLGFIADIRGLKNGSRKQALNRMIDVCGLSGVIGRPIGVLSKGYRQRVGLAQAMIHDPELLILDEPTSGLDPNQIIEIRELIKDIGREKTVILSTHILPEVSATCSRVIIISAGRLAASGTPEELISDQTASERIVARIRGDYDAVCNALTAAPFVQSYKNTAQEDGLNSFEIIPGQDGAGEKLFGLVKDGGWSLSELRKEGASLEDVFTKLTRGE